MRDVAMHEAAVEKQATPIAAEDAAAIRTNADATDCALGEIPRLGPGPSERFSKDLPRLGPGNSGRSL